MHMPKLERVDWQVYRKPAATGSATAPTMLLNLTLGEATAAAGGSREVSVEMSKEQLEAMIASLSKIKEQARSPSPARLRAGGARTTANSRMDIIAQLLLRQRLPCPLSPTRSLMTAHAAAVPPSYTHLDRGVGGTPLIHDGSARYCFALVCSSTMYDLCRRRTLRWAWVRAILPVSVLPVSVPCKRP